jgi:disulfide bond formation protein DsbB
LGHTEETQQWIPLLTLGLGLVACIALAARPSPVTVKTFRVVMVLFVVAAMAGLYFHYSGNAEFELEMYPSMRGMELFRESMTGATPSLAPGMLAQLGLLGLAITWKHPALRR